MAMMLSPPGLFSTTTGWPHLTCSFSASNRAPISAPAPGPNGTMNLTARVGQFCACAGASTVRNSARRAAILQSFPFMMVPRGLLQLVGAVAADDLQIALGGALHHRLAVRPDRAVGERAVDAVEPVGLQRLHHAFD